MMDEKERKRCGRGNKKGIREGDGKGRKPLCKREDERKRRKRG